MTANKHRIKNGPSRWDLMLASFENSTDSAKGTRDVNFELEDYENVFGSDWMSVEITSLSRPDKSDTNWFQFKGWTYIFPDKHSRRIAKRVTGTFWTNGRTGELKVMVNESTPRQPGTFG